MALPSKSFRKAMQLQELGAGITFGNGFGSPHMADDGKIGFVSDLQGAGVNSTNYKAAWLISALGLQPLARA